MVFAICHHCTRATYALLFDVSLSNMPLKSQCTRNKANRSMTRWVHKAMLEEMQQRVTTHPEKIKARKSLVEHPFGTMKRGMDRDIFLPEASLKQREIELTILAYNLKRVMNIMGIEGIK